MEMVKVAVVWPCFPLSSALQKCALNTTSSLKMQGTLKVKAAFFGKFLVDVRIVVLTVVDILGKRMSYPFGNPGHQLLALAASVGGKRIINCTFVLANVAPSHLFICWAVDRSQSICALFPRPLFPFCIWVGGNYPKN